MKHTLIILLCFSSISWCEDTFIEYNNQARVFAERGNTVQVLKCGLSSIEIQADPSVNFLGYMYVMSGYATQKEFKKVIDVANGVLSTKKQFNKDQNAFLMLMMGASQFELSDYANAAINLRKSIEFAPTPMACNHFAWMFAVGKGVIPSNEALANATLACELTKFKDVRIVDTLAAVYARIGDYDNAIIYSRMALFDAKGEDKDMLEGHMAHYAEKRPIEK